MVLKLTFPRFLAAAGVLAVLGTSAWWLAHAEPARAPEARREKPAEPERDAEKRETQVKEAREEVKRTHARLEEMRAGLEKHAQEVREMENRFRQSMHRLQELEGGAQRVPEREGQPPPRPFEGRGQAGPPDREAQPPHRPFDGRGQAGPPDFERRLTELERKLDAVLHELERRRAGGDERALPRRPVQDERPERRPDELKRRPNQDEEKRPSPRGRD